MKNLFLPARLSFPFFPGKEFELGIFEQVIGFKDSKRLDQVGLFVIVRNLQLINQLEEHRAEGKNTIDPVIAHDGQRLFLRGRTGGRN